MERVDEGSCEELQEGKRGGIDAIIYLKSFFKKGVGKRKSNEG